MSQKISLKNAERKAFRSAYNDGLWDIALGCFFLMFAVPPLLSPTLGDFWSVAVFPPFLGIVFLVVWLVRKYVVTPRIGSVKFSRTRITKLLRFTLVMAAINIIVLILGSFAAASIERISGQITSSIFGLIFLVGLSIAAYFLDFNRLYIYGLLVGLSPLAGEWLYIQGHTSHHGFPLTFGTSAGIMILVGTALFVHLLLTNPFPVEGIPSEQA